MLISFLERVRETNDLSNRTAIHLPGLGDWRKLLHERTLFQQPNRQKRLFNRSQAIPEILGLKFAQFRRDINVTQAFLKVALHLDEAEIPRQELDVLFTMASRRMNRLKRGNDHTDKFGRLFSQLGFRVRTPSERAHQTQRFDRRNWYAFPHLDRTGERPFGKFVIRSGHVAGCAANQRSVAVDFLPHELREEIIRREAAHRLAVQRLHVAVELLAKFLRLSDNGIPLVSRRLLPKLQRFRELGVDLGLAGLAGMKLQTEWRKTEFGEPSSHDIKRGLLLRNKQNPFSE